MCVVSMVIDHTLNRVPDWTWQTPTILPTISRAEFDALKREVDGLMQLMRKAKLYDIEEVQPDCEDKEKLEKLRKVAAILGLDLDKYLNISEMVT